MTITHLHLVSETLFRKNVLKSLIIVIQILIWKVNKPDFHDNKLENFFHFDIIMTYDGYSGCIQRKKEKWDLSSNEEDTGSYFCTRRMAMCLRILVWETGSLNQMIFESQRSSIRQLNHILKTLKQDAGYASRYWIRDCGGGILCQVSDNSYITTMQLVL